MQLCSMKCLGVGDGWPCGDRNHSSFLYRLGPTALLVDCGEPVQRSLRSMRVGPDALDSILLSHLHFDHMAGLFMLIQGSWLEGRKRPLTIHLPEEGIDPIRSMLRTAYIFDDLLPFNLRFAPIRPNEPIDVDGVRVTPHLTTHLDQLRATFQDRHPKPFAAFSFLIEDADHRIAHSGDIGAASDLEVILAQPVDVLVCELAHVEHVEVARRIRKHAIQQVVFIHLARSLWENLDTTRRALAHELGSMPFRIARDGDDMDLTKPASA